MTNEAKGFVRRWIDEIYTHQRFECIRDLASSPLVCHTDEGAWHTTPRDYERMVRQHFHLGVIPGGRRVYSLVAEENTVAALGACVDRYGDPVSYWLQVFQLHRNRVAGLWMSGYVGGVDWGIVPKVISTEPHKGAEAENKAIVRRWWDEMYGQHRLDELMPVLAGPHYIRHEPTGTSVTTIAAHLQQIKNLYGPERTVPRLYFGFALLAEGDKVVGIGTMYSDHGQGFGLMNTYSFVQMFRLSRGKIVESWFPGWCVGVDWAGRSTVSAENNAAGTFFG